jgi:hypothetical protein
MSAGESASSHSSGVPCHYGIGGLERKRQRESTSTFSHTVLKILHVIAKILM